MKKIISQILSICFIFSLFTNLTNINSKTVLASTNTDNSFSDIYVFDREHDGYPVFRIPGIITTKNNTLLAYAEARKTTSDWADMDIVMKRSTDGGETWSDLKVLVDGVSVGKTVNNPIMITERNSNTIHFIYCVEYEQAFYMKSTDDGLTFSEPREITSAFDAVKDEYNWKVIATGPGHGIELENDRLLVPVWLALNKSHSPSVVSTLYSDDKGKTWHLGEIIYAQGDMPNPNETSAVQLTNGDVLLNIRNTANTEKRAISISRDGSSNWTKPLMHEDLDDPTCFGSIARLTENDEYYTNRLIASNVNNVGGRNNLVVKMSTDEGQTWSYTKTISRANIAYSDLAVSNNQENIYLLYEPNNGHKTMNLAKFNLEWLTDGEQSLDKRNTPPTQAIPTQTKLMLNENWDKHDISWIKEGSDTAVVENNTLNLASNNGTSNTLISNYDINIQEDYTLEFKLKVNEFYDGPTGDFVNFGTKVHDGFYRLMLDVKANGIYALTDIGRWEHVAPLTIDNDWHIYKAIVSSGNVNLFIDDVNVASFKLQEKKSNDYIQHWTRAKTNDSSNSLQEYVKITNNFENIDLNLIDKSNMSATATSEETTSENNSAACTIDSVDSSFWHTDWDNPQLPQELNIDLGQEYSLSQIGMLPRQIGSSNGLITKYELYLADNLNQFAKTDENTWSYGTNYSDRSEKIIDFPKQNVRYLKLKVLEGVGNFAALSEVKFYRNSVEISSAQDIHLETTVGTIPILPKYISTNLDSGEIINLPVMWNEFIPENFLHTGTTTMEGYINGSNIKITANITINPAPLIPNNLSFEIFESDLNSIPKKLNITFTDGSIESHKVVWKNLDQSIIQTPGEIELIGYLNEINLKVSAKVTIKENTFPTIKPQKVQNFKASDITSNSVTLTWDKNSNNSFLIYKDGKLIDTITNNMDAKYVVNTLKSNTIYNFKIVEINELNQKSRPTSLNIRTK